MPIALLRRFRDATRSAYDTQGGSQILWRLAEMDRALGNLTEAAEEYATYAELEPGKAGALALSRLMAGTSTDTEGLENGVVPFVLVRDLAPESKLVEIRQALEDRRPRFKDAKVSNVDGQYVDPNIRVALFVQGDTAFHALIREWFLGAIEKQHLVERLGIEPITGGQEEIGAIAYASGGKYALHRDSDPRVAASSRQMTAIWFVHDAPKAFTGGDLLLHDEPPQGQGFTRIVPERNSAIFFPSKYLHEVTPVESSVEDVLSGRVIVNAWFHMPQLT